MVKQVIIIRKDLKMRRGKEAAQASHAAMAFMTNRIKDFENAINSDVIQFWNPVLKWSDAEKEWMYGSFTKICLQVDSEEELINIHKKAKEKGLVSHLIIDSGKTEFNGVPTPTCVAIGPDVEEKIDPITSHLKLY